MKCFIVLSALVAVAMAKPGHLYASHHVSHVAPLTYAAPYVHLVPGAPIGHDGRVVDTPEVAHAKAEHAAAHVNEKISLAHEAHNSADLLTYAPASYHSNVHHVAAGLPIAAATTYHGIHAYQAVAPVAYAKIVPGAPIGHDGRVVDTPEVAHAKAEHAAAHVNEKITLAHEGAKHSVYAAPQVHLVAAHSVPAYASHYVAAAHQW